MKKSIVTDNMEFCIVCGRPREAVHHVFFGTALRKISDKHGFVVPLCNYHHNGAAGVHNNNQVLDKKSNSTHSVSMKPWGIAGKNSGR